MSVRGTAATGRRVVITGLGVVSCLGTGVERFWRALLAREYGIRPLTRLDGAKHRIAHGGEVKGFALAADPDPAVQFLLAAGREAAEHAGLGDAPVPPSRRAVVVGTNFGAMERTARFLADLARDRPRAGEPEDFRAAHLGVGARALADALGFEGTALTLSLSCASGNAALARAADLLRRREADVVLAGGYDAISEAAWAGLCALRTMTAGVLRPFDRRRDGTIFSEGAGVLVLESLDSARARGAEVLAEFSGCWTNNNAFHMTHPDPGGAGLVRAMRGALHEAGLAPDDVDHINSHGTGTVYNDRVETAAIKTVFGERAHRIPVNSIKSMVGHGMGAASAFEAVCAVLTLRHGVVPPTANLEERDPDCDLDYVSDGPRACAVRVVLSNAAGIGGANSAILLSRYSAEGARGKGPRRPPALQVDRPR